LPKANAGRLRSKEIKETPFLLRLEKIELLGFEGVNSNLDLANVAIRNWGAKGGIEIRSVQSWLLEKWMWFVFWWIGEELIAGLAIRNSGVRG
jgi:hypothetical protein